MTAGQETPDVQIKLLGEFKIVVRANPEGVHKFRSRSAEQLLAWLALRLGRTMTKSEVVDLLWPDSDGDRQAQNMRRAISDIRQVVEGGPHESSLVQSQSDRIWLEAARVETDVRQFTRLTDAGLAGNDAEQNLRQALQLYSGPLLPGHQPGWLEVYRMELEERFSQAVEAIILLLLESGRQDEALRIGRQAVLAAPLREDVHVALVRAYASAGLRSQAISQFEELEALLEFHWGEAPSPRSIAALESIGRDTVPDSRTVDSPRTTAPSETIGGGMPYGSPFYIIRECDRLLGDALAKSEPTVLIHGTRQVGKTSLLGKVLNGSRRANCSVAITDFQVLSRSQLATADSLCRVLAYGLATQLGVQLDLARMWNDWIGPNSNLDAVVDAVLRQKNGQVVWAMDEADLLFGTDYADDFFGLIRAWHNRRAMDENASFNRLTVVISYATEAHLFIRDINQSPFNVGLRIPMRDFNLAETGELCGRYGLKLSDGEIRRIVTLTGGQPWLTRKALDTLAHGGASLESIEGDAAREDGPFGEHLRRLLAVTSRDEVTQAEIVRFLRHEPFADPKAALRFVAGGMLTRNSDGRIDFRVPAYRKFLSRYLLPTD